MEERTSLLPWLNKYKIPRDGKWLSARFLDMTDDEIVEVARKIDRTSLILALISYVHYAKELESRFGTEL